ncbi:MAG: hypothetical protein J1F14_07395 [Treponema sp.]|nr:hypothetical protein [Treponema sp.]
MKRFALVLIAAVCMALPAFSQESEDSKPFWDHGDNVSSISYHSVNIYKVLDQRDAFVVLFERDGLRVGKAVVPKKWAQENPRKFVLRNKPKGLPSYMTVFYRDGEFSKVILTVSLNKQDPVWSILPNSTKLSGTDADTLEITW